MGKIADQHMQRECAESLTRVAGAAQMFATVEHALTRPFPPGMPAQVRAARIACPDCIDLSSPAWCRTCRGTGISECGHDDCFDTHGEWHGCDIAKDSEYHQWVRSLRTYERIGPETAYCERCGCNKSGYGDEPNVKTEACDDDACPCHREFE